MADVTSVDSVLNDETSADPMLNGDDGTDQDEEELLKMKEKVEEMEAEAAKLREQEAARLRELQKESMEGATGTSDAMETEDDQQAADERSIYVKNVEYASLPEQVQAHFSSCGTINRVTIPCDRFTGHPKGYAYVEFADPASIETALSLNDSLFNGRLIEVYPKRTNIPGVGRGRGRGRGGYRGGGYRGGRGGKHAYSPYRARGRGRGRG